VTLADLEAELLAGWPTPLTAPTTRNDLRRQLEAICDSIGWHPGEPVPLRLSQEES
jgi:hypothetical protein